MKGCVATGATPEEVKKNITEAVEFHVQSSIADNDPLPEEFIGDYELVYNFNIKYG